MQSADILSSRVCLLCYYRCFFSEQCLFEINNAKNEVTLVVECGRCTKSMRKYVVSECLDMFNVLSVADYIVKRKSKFLTGYINSQNSLCNLLCSTAKKDLSDMTLR